MRLDQIIIVLALLLNSSNANQFLNTLRRRYLCGGGGSERSGHQNLGSMMAMLAMMNSNNVNSNFRVNSGLDISSQIPRQSVADTNFASHLSDINSESSVISSMEHNLQVERENLAREQQRTEAMRNEETEAINSLIRSEKEDLQKVISRQAEINISNQNLINQQIANSQLQNSQSNSHMASTAILIPQMVNTASVVPQMVNTASVVPLVASSSNCISQGSSGSGVIVGVNGGLSNGVISGVGSGVISGVSGGVINGVSVGGEYC